MFNDALAYIEVRLISVAFSENYLVLSPPTISQRSPEIVKLLDTLLFG